MSFHAPVDVCPVCLQSFEDARLLPCLHSTCTACIDKLAVTATNGIVSCPLCQTKVTLPASGASGLPKDVSVSIKRTTTDRLLECGMCDDREKRKKPAMWCKQCCLSLCVAHIGAHIALNIDEVHVVVPLSMATPEMSDDDNIESGVGAWSTPTCAHHCGEALKYHCGVCDVAVCGACAAIGDHRMHQNIRLIKDILKERKRQVTEKVDKLGPDVIRKLEHSLQAVAKVTTDLTRKAGLVRSDIREAGKRTIAMVKAQVKQMVQELDDLEQCRFKVLDQQRVELNLHLDAAINAVRFRDRIMRLSDSNKEAQFSLLHALDMRTAALLSTHIKEKPEHHSRLMLDCPSETDLAHQIKNSIGKVSPRQASAEHCELDVATQQGAVGEEAVVVIVYTKDNNGEYLRTGGDVISTRWSATHAAEGVPPTTITDNGNGSYTISCVFQSVGKFQLQVYVNGEKMATHVTIPCVEFTSGFDEDESHPSITISQDRQQACFYGRSLSYLSIVGISPMRSGRFSWKMKIHGGNPMCYMLGITSKPLSSQRMNDFKNTAFCWQTNGENCFYRDGARFTGSCASPTADRETFQLDLDCDRHTLQITNLHSGDIGMLSNLPDREYFQFASQYYTGSSVQFVDFALDT